MIDKTSKTLHPFHPPYLTLLHLRVLHHLLIPSLFILVFQVLPLPEEDVLRLVFTMFEVPAAFGKAPWLALASTASRRMGM